MYLGIPPPLPEPDGERHAGAVQEDAAGLLPAGVVLDRRVVRPHHGGHQVRPPKMHIIPSLVLKGSR